MSRVIRERWKLIVAVVLLTAIAVPAIWTAWPGGAGAATAATTAEQTSFASFSDAQRAALRQQWLAVDRLRRQAGLGDEALRPMDLTATQCEALYTVAWTWQQQNGPTLEALEARVAAGSAADAAGHQAWIDAMVQRRQLLEGLRQALLAQLPVEAQAVAQAIDENAGVPAPYSRLRLTPEQRAQLREELYTQAFRLGAARTAEERQQVTADHQRRLQGLLGASYQWELDQSAQATGGAAVAATRAKLVPPDVEVLPAMADVEPNG